MYVCMCIDRSSEKATVPLLLCDIVIQTFWFSKFLKDCQEFCNFPRMGEFISNYSFHLEIAKFLGPEILKYKYVNELSY